MFLEELSLGMTREAGPFLYKTGLERLGTEAAAHLFFLCFKNLSVVVAGFCSFLPLTRMVKGIVIFGGVGEKG